MSGADDYGDGGTSPPALDSGSGQTSLTGGTSPSEGGWIVDLEQINPYTNLSQTSNPYTNQPALDLNPVSGNVVDAYGAPMALDLSDNPYTGSHPIDPYTGQQHVYSSGALSNDVLQGVTGVRYVMPETVLAGQTPIDRVQIDGRECAHYRIVLGGTSYDAYWNDVAFAGRVLLVPIASAAPSATDLTQLLVTPSSGVGSGLQLSGGLSIIGLSALDSLNSTLSQTATGNLSLTTGPALTSPASVTSTSVLPPSFSQTSANISAPTSSFLSTIVGDLLATLAGVFDPTSVTPYLQPRTPANLPPGLQRMGQLNASFAKQSMFVNSAAARTGMVVAGSPYVVAMGAMLAPEAGAAGMSAGIRLAAQFPRASALATEVSSAMAETTLPRVAMTEAAPRIAVAGVGAATAAGLHEARKISQQAPLLHVGTERLDEFTALHELNALFGEKVRTAAKEMVAAMTKGDYSLLKGWLHRDEYNLAMRALSGKAKPALAQALTGTAIERMVARAIHNDPRTAPYFRWVGGARQPDFYGVGKLQGFFWDVTTIAGKAAHETEIRTRWYAKRTFVHAFTWSPEN